MNKITIMVLVAMLLCASVALADNPADTTFFHRSFPCVFVKAAALTGGGRLGFINAPVTNKANLGITHFASKNGVVMGNELTASSKVGIVDFGFDSLTLKIKGVGSSQINTLGVDIAVTKSIAVGAVLPLNNHSETALGARITKKNITFFVSTTPSVKNSTVFGATIALEDVKVDLATSNGSTEIHLSRMISTKSGAFRPEIKIQNKNAGFVLGFFPK